MADESNFFRTYARDVGLDPLVAGADNVQDAIAGGAGGVQLGNNTSAVVVQDTPTALTGDGGTHTVSCLIASPPTWMDNAGNITAAGLYRIAAGIAATAGPTTPALYILAAPLASVGLYIPCDGMGASGGAAVQGTIALAAGDLPYAADTTIIMPTDATEAVTVRITVARLAS